MSTLLNRWTNVIRRPVTWRLVVALAILVTGTLASPPAPASAEQTNPGAVLDIMRQDLRSFWTPVLRQWGHTYTESGTYWYNTQRYPGSVRSTCGVLEVWNSWYCSRDRTVYLDAAFHWDKLRNVGDFAVAVIIAHEWAHHVQNLTGVEQLKQQRRITPKQYELQADCWTGVWTRAANNQGIVEPGDLDEAAALISTLGDQPGTQPDDPKAHGTAQERYNWFLRGYYARYWSECQTF